MLTTKKIYIDSRFKTSDSVSHTDFKYDLGLSVNMPDGAHFYMDDVNIPNTWYSVEQGMNSKLYVRVLFVLDEAGIKDYIIDIPSDVYNSESFTLMIKTKLTSVVGDFWQVVYDPNKNCMNISSTYMLYFQFFTDDDLRNPATNWGKNNANAGDTSIIIQDLMHLGSINEVIKNYGASPHYTQTNHYASGFLDMLRYNNIYISSNLGVYQTLGPRPRQQTLVRKVPVTASSGNVINDRVVGKHDILDCSKISLSILSFRFEDVYGNTINLRGCHVSFSLIFTTLVEDR